MAQRRIPAPLHRLGSAFLHLGGALGCLAADRRRDRSDAAAGRDRHPDEPVEQGFFQFAGKPRLERVPAPDGDLRLSGERDDGRRGLPGLCQAAAAIALAALAQRQARRRMAGRGRHYQLNFVGTGVDNPDQRISENTKHATEMAVEFGLGIFDKSITLVSFIGILWTISGALDVSIGSLSFQIPGYMVFAALLYAGIGSVADLFRRPADRRRQHAAECERGGLPLRPGAVAREQRGGGADPRRARRKEGADRLFRRRACLDDRA